MLLRRGAYKLAGEAARHFGLPPSYHRIIRLNQWADAVAEGAVRGGWSDDSGDGGGEASAARTKLKLAVDFETCEEHMAPRERAMLCTDLAITAASSAPLATSLLAQARSVIAAAAAPDGDTVARSSQSCAPANSAAAVMRKAMHQTTQQAETAVGRRSSGDGVESRPPGTEMCELLAGLAPAATEGAAERALEEVVDEAGGGEGSGANAAGEVATNGGVLGVRPPDPAALLVRLQKRFEAVARLDEAVGKADAGTRQYLRCERTPTQLVGTLITTQLTQCGLFICCRDFRLTPMLIEHAHLLHASDERSVWQCARPLSHHY
jgi:hypothetical protein